MRSVSSFFLLCALLIAWQTPLVAQPSYLTFSEFDIEVSVDCPEGFLEEEVEDVSLVFQNQKEKGRKLIFDCFVPEQELGEPSFDDVNEYVHMIFEKFFNPLICYDEWFYRNENYFFLSFTTRDAQGREVYCFGSVILDDELVKDYKLVYAVFAMNCKSLKNAGQDCKKLLETVKVYQ